MYLGLEKLNIFPVDLISFGKSMKVLIMVGGKGTRLRPYTNNIPKALLPIGDRPILEIILYQLKSAGVEEVTLAVGHLSQLFEAFFQDGSRLGLKINYLYEEKALGTAGAIAFGIDSLGEDFIVMNGDVLTTLDYKKMFDYHKKENSAATIATYKREVKLDFGVIKSNSKGKLESYQEKPKLLFDFGMGVNIVNAKTVTPYLKKGEYLDIPDLMIKLVKNNHSVSCYNEKCFWLDMGRPEDYDKANEAFEKKKKDFLPNVFDKKL